MLFFVDFYFNKNAKLQLFIHIPEEIKLCGLILLAWLNAQLISDFSEKSNVPAQIWV